MSLVNRPQRSRWIRVCFSAVALASCGLLAVISLQAQQHFQKSYPASKNISVVLKNSSGTITVESWTRDQVKISATLEAPAAKVEPRNMDSSLVIDVLNDNRGRGETGDVNFKLYVPVGASVDLQTRQGDIRVSNIRGGSVRAHVSLEGDIELTGINAERVIAQNTMGLIFFDGEFSTNGKYMFQSGQGNISIRIPADSAFQLTASSQNRNIKLGEFWNKEFRNMGDGRKYEGGVRNGQATVTVTSFLGSITFLRR